MRGLVSLALASLTLCACAENSTPQGTSAPDAAEPSAQTPDAAVEPSHVPFDGELHRQWLTLGEFYTLSSPRAVDLDLDGVMDIVTGHGIEAQTTDSFGKDLSTYGSVTAHSGSTGERLWEFTAKHDIVGSAVFLDADDDQVPDVIIGGRYAELVAVSGRDGTLLWRFFDGTVDESRAQGLFNFYSPIVVPDQDGDGVLDLVAPNGGDATKADYEARPPGHLLALSGRTGAVLGSILMPDAQETYMSPSLLMRDEPEVVFGSGGETIAGSLWRIPLADLFASRTERAVELAKGTNTGFIAPCALVDLTGDGMDDIVGVTFGAEVVAIDGATDAMLFQRELNGVQTYAAPVVARVTPDETPDLWLSFDEGKFPTYTANRHVLLDGKTGEILHDEVLGTIGPSGHVAADLTGDGRDELIVGTNRATADLTGKRDTLYAPLRFEPAWFDPLTMKVTAFAEPFTRPAVSAPLLEDLDRDGDLELVLVTSDVGSLTAKYRLERFELHARTPKTPMHGAYMGGRYDGRWNPR